VRPQARPEELQRPVQAKAPKAPARAAKAPTSAAKPQRPAAPRRGVSPAKAARRESRAQVRARLAEVRRFTGASRLRRGITIAVVSALTALVALVLASVYTPMLAIDKINIVGLNRMKHSTVYNSVRSLIGTPLTTVDEAVIQQRLANFPLIESFTTVALPPHTLELYIQERQPIGVVNIGSTAYLYDPAGVQIGPTQHPGRYPLILVNGDPSHSASFREAVSVLMALPVSLYPKVASIQATSVDDVRIHLRGVSNRQILWGDASSSVLKSKVLAALMANVKRNGSVVIDVSSPTAPTVRYGSF